MARTSQDIPYSFNPRSPRGERRIKSDAEKEVYVSIHAPHVGSDVSERQTQTM